MELLIVKLSSLGDVIQTMPVVHDLQLHFPGIHIDWMVEEAFAPLVHRVAGVRQVFPIAERRWRKSRWSATTRVERAAFTGELQQHSYDAVIDFQGLVKSALAARLARLKPGGFSATYGNASEACGYEWPVRLLLKRHFPMPNRIHAVARYRLLAGLALGYKAEGEALARLLVESGLRIALPQSNPAELALVTRIAQALDGHADIWPRLSLPEVMDRMALSAGVIGVDSGLSHMAVALNLPHVQIFSQPRAWRAGPVGHTHQVAVGGEQAPDVAAVWHAWQGVQTSFKAL